MVIVDAHMSVIIRITFIFKYKGYAGMFPG